AGAEKIFSLWSAPSLEAQRLSINDQSIAGLGSELPLRVATNARCSARVKTTNVSLPKSLRPKAGWGVPVAWLTLCVVWSSTWLAIKIGLRDLPPISFVAIRFLIAIIVLVAVSIGRTHLLPRTRNDYFVLAFTGILMFAVNYTLLFWAELYVSSGLA